MAQRVLERASESSLKLQGAQLTIQRYIPQSASNMPQPPPATQQPPDPRRVVVDNIAPCASKEYLMLFFENKKRSGGGEVDEVYIDHGKGRAVIVFKEAEGKASGVFACGAEGNSNEDTFWLKIPSLLERCPLVTWSVTCTHSTCCQKLCPV